MLPKKLLLNRSSEMLSDMAPFGIVVTCWWPLDRIGSMKMPSNSLQPLPWPPHTPQASIVASEPTTPSHPTGWTANMRIFGTAAFYPLRRPTRNSPQFCRAFYSQQLHFSRYFFSNILVYHYNNYEYYIWLDLCASFLNFCSIWEIVFQKFKHFF